MTIFFQPEYNDLILSGEKEYTIRKGDRRRPLKVGHTYFCKNKMFSKESFALVEIINIDVKPFSKLTEQDAKDDLFGSLKECKQTLIDLNGEDIKNSLVSKIHFRLVR